LYVSICRYTQTYRDIHAFVSWHIRYIMYNDEGYGGDW
jgi:hypothetical protein